MTSTLDSAEALLADRIVRHRLLPLQYYHPPSSHWRSQWCASTSPKCCPGQPIQHPGPTQFCRGGRAQTERTGEGCAQLGLDLFGHFSAFFFSICFVLDLLRYPNGCTDHDFIAPVSADADLRHYLCIGYRRQRLPQALWLPG